MSIEQRAAASAHLNKFRSVSCVNGARARIAYEHHEVDRLVAAGYDVLWPASVCDRIAIKDGRVLFVEFKKPGQTLRPAQQRVRDTCPEQYVVIEYAHVVKSVDAAGSDPAGQ
jgi:hypothetical protein